MEKLLLQFVNEVAFGIFLTWQMKKRCCNLRKWLAMLRLMAS